MSYHAHSITAPSSNSSESAVQISAQSTGTTFWLTLAVVWLSLLSVEHSMYFASADYLERGDGNRVVEATSGSSMARQLSIVVLGGLGVALLTIPARAPVSPRRGMVFLILLTCSLLIVSASWADDESLSFKRAAQPVLLMIAALGLAKHLQPRQLCKFTALVAGAMLLLGIGAVLIQGTFWQGTAYRFGGTLHPNAQAVNCAALSLATLALFDDRRQSFQQRWPWLLVLGIGVAFLLLTRSRTTTAAFGVGVLTYFFVGAPPLRKCVLAAITATLVLCCLVLLLLPETGADELLLGAVRMGRGEQNMASLTGRLPIWQAVINHISERPILGYGYGAFWTPQRVWEFSFIHRWEFNHAHSAYFETILNVGIIGLSLGLLMTAYIIGSAAKGLRATGDVGYRFIIAMMVVALVHGLIDSNFVTVGFAPLLIMMCLGTIALRGKLAVGPQPNAVKQPLVPSSFRTALNY
jgi:O-antigen ligase